MNRKVTSKIYKALSILLLYPTEEIISLLPEVKSIIYQEKLSNDEKNNFDKLVNFLQFTDLIELQEKYVGAFDKQKCLSLHMFEHVHGDSRDRGAAMIDLQELYEKDGFTVISGELPDYLPLFLEYLSTLTVKESGNILGESINIIASIGKCLKSQDNLYHFIFYYLEKLSTVKADQLTLNKTINSASNINNSNDKLDKSWLEKPAFNYQGV